MRIPLKIKLTGSTLSNGSCRLVYESGYCREWSIQRGNNLDVVNHSVWVGKRVKEQTEIASFVGRFRETSQLNTRVGSIKDVQKVKILKVCTYDIKGT